MFGVRAKLLCRYSKMAAAKRGATLLSLVQGILRKVTSTSQCYTIQLFGKSKDGNTNIEIIRYVFFDE